MREAQENAPACQLSPGTAMRNSNATERMIGKHKRHAMRCEFNARRKHVQGRWHDDDARVQAESTERRSELRGRAEGVLREY